MHGNVPRIHSAGEQLQAEMMQRQVRAQAKLQMAGEFTNKLLEGGAHLSMQPETIADFALELAEHVLAKFSLDNAVEKIKDVSGVQQ